MLGRKECIQMLIDHGVKVILRNKGGWSALHEAISYGDRQIISTILRETKTQVKSALNTQRPNLIKGFKNMGDFCLEMKWDFSSWIPLVSRILPSDICKITKKVSNSGH